MVIVVISSPEHLGDTALDAYFDWQQQNVHYMLAELTSAPSYYKLTSQEKAMRPFTD